MSDYDNFLIMKVVGNSPKVASVQPAQKCLFQKMHCTCIRGRSTATKSTSVKSAGRVSIGNFATQDTSKKLVRMIELLSDDLDC